MAKSNAGRPTVMTELTLKKLEEAFAYGASDNEACFYADISHQTLYDYQKKHPEFIERKEALKERPILTARQTVIDNLSDTKNAQWYLERKRKKEFGPNLIVDSGENPIRVLLESYGITEGKDDATETDEPIQSSSSSET